MNERWDCLIGGGMEGWTCIEVWVAELIGKNSGGLAVCN